MKKRRKSMIAGWLVVIAVLLFLSTAVAGGVYYITKREVTGQLQEEFMSLKNAWYRDANLTAIVVERGDAYLKDAWLGDEVTLADYLDEDITIRIHMEEAGAVLTGTVDEASYEAAEQKALNAMEDAFACLIRMRLEASGLWKEGDDAGKLAEETLGMSLAEYLSSYGPLLLPSKEELMEEYTIVSGE